MTSPWTKCPTTELSLLLPVLGHISLSWRNLSKRKVQRRMSRSILLSRNSVVKPVKTLFQSTNVCPTIECSTSRTLAARASFKLLSTRFENIHSESLFCMSVIGKESYAYSIERDQLREGLHGKKTFSLWHCPNVGGVYPCPNFLALFKKCIFGQ